MSLAATLAEQVEVEAEEETDTVETDAAIMEQSDLCVYIVTQTIILCFFLLLFFIDNSFFLSLYQESIFMVPFDIKLICMRKHLSRSWGSCPRPADMHFFVAKSR